MSDFFLSQLLAGLALVCGVVSFQCKTRRAILLWLTGTGLANACHFFVLARPSAGFLYLIIGARSFAAAFSSSQKLMYGFVGLMVASFFYSYESPLGFLGLFASLSATYGSFQTTEQRVRAFHMVSNATWMVHNILVPTPVAALTEAAFLTSNTLGYWRFHRGKGAADLGGDTEDRTPSPTKD